MTINRKPADSAWAYPTVQAWERLAGYKASQAFRVGFRCARDDYKRKEWQTGYDMGRMTNSLLRALAAQTPADARARKPI